MDLLTVLMHELGHVIGKDSRYDQAARDDLMYAWLTTGERRLPVGINATIGKAALRALAMLQVCRRKKTLRN